MKAVQLLALLASLGAGASVQAAEVAAPAAPAEQTAPVPPAAPEPAGPQATAPGSPAQTATAAPKPAKPPPAPVKVSQDPRPSLSADTFVATLRAADQYRALAEAGGWPVIAPGAPLKAGDRGALVAALKRRLALTGDLAPEHEAGDAFDAGVVAAVKRFQGRHGLPETGLVGPKTVAALNVPAETRFRQLTQSALRLSGSAFPFGERYVVVNIPAATVEAVEGGAVARRYVAVVGKKDRASPTVETRITNVNLNPTWTAPVSLVKKDIIPKMRKDPAYLAKNHMRIFNSHGREVDPALIDWSTERAADYLIRQDAGLDNSLGQIRIDMPNAHAVYMHDTPSKRLFARDERFHSSGCVRVADVRAFSEWLLAGTPTAKGALWTPAEIDAAIAAGARKDVRLARAVPVAWVYLTGYATADGVAHFRDDVYGLDAEGTAPPPADAPQAQAKPARAAAL